MDVLVKSKSIICQIVAENEISLMECDFNWPFPSRYNTCAELDITSWGFCGRENKSTGVVSNIGLRNIHRVLSKGLNLGYAWGKNRYSVVCRVHVVLLVIEAVKVKELYYYYFTQVRFGSSTVWNTKVLTIKVVNTSIRSVSAGSNQPWSNVGGGRNSRGACWKSTWLYREKALLKEKHLQV